MKLLKTLPSFVASFGLLAAFRLDAQVVEQVIISKSSDWVQTSSAAAFIDPSPPGPGYGGPYSFSVHVSGSDLSGITAPVVTLPAGSLQATPSTLHFNADQGEWAFGADANQYGTIVAGDVDTQFAPGTYGITVMGNSFNLSLPNTAFPANTPTVTLTGGSWVRGVYMINVTQALTVTTNAFTNFDQNVDGAISLEVDGVTDQLVFHSANPSANNFLTATIPANTLVAGTEYSAEAGFYAITDKSTAIANSLNAAVYGRNTRFRIVAYSGTLPSATLHGIGDLGGGGINSEVRDATRVGNVIYAVGSSSGNSGVPAGRDTAIIWTSTGGLMPLPNLVDNTVATTFITASAITRDAAYIASRARSVTPGGARQAVRITTADRSILSFAGLVGGANNSAAVAISNDGSILYGLADNNTQAVRYTASGPTGTVIPFLNAGDTTNAPASRGSSFSGAVMVGTSINASTAHNGAFRYVHGTGVSAIPYLSGGTWNSALAVSPDGNLTLVFGNSSSAPQGEFYLHNATAATVTPLGTPNGSRNSNGAGGMTGDGSVVVANLNNLVTTNGTTTGQSASYMHNSHGWHSLQAVAAAAGVNLTGWTLDPVQGMSPDGTMVWGSGTHNGRPEGFVLEFSPGYLAAYTEPATYSTPGQAIVGAWTFGDTTSAAGGNGVLIFYPNGYYVHIENPAAEDLPHGCAGFERGQYTWNANTGLLTFKTLLDTNGDVGLSDEDQGPGFTVTVSGNTATATTPDGSRTLTRVIGSSPIVGAFGHADLADESASIVFLPNGYFYFMQDGDSTPAGDPNGHDGIEWGTYTWDSSTHNFVANVLVDTNGEWGMSHPETAQTIVFSPDLLTLTLSVGGEDFPVPRVSGNPALIIQPAGQTVAPGASVTFTAVAAGSPAPTYQWKKNGVVIAGATNATYTIASAQTSDAGSYTVVATNTAGSVTSAAAALAVTTSIVGDYNNDGVADTAWTNPAPGQSNLWLMGGAGGTTFIGGADLGVVDTNARMAAVADFNGDGKPDILWQNLTAGSRYLWLMNGSAHGGDYSLGSINADWSIVAAADFNGDGKADILWQNTNSGERYIWFMNGLSHTSDASLGFVSTQWSIVAAADFNADGKPDILWQNTTSGERYVWYMNGTTHTGDASLGIIPKQWSIVGAADFNSDGKPDLLWRNTSTNEGYVWYMNGVTHTSDVSLGVAPNQWTIAATGDFNADGKPDLLWQKPTTTVASDINGDGEADILWQNTANGERYLWYMSGFTRTGETSLGVVPAAWSIAAKADFNGDGHLDLLWQNSATGERYVWFMNGATHTGDVSLGVVPVEWSIVAAADFNGDSKPDILWQNTVNGERYVWFMNGTTHAGDVSLRVVPTQWSIAAAADFNNDGKPDILWQNTATGERYVWFMNGTTHTADVSLGIIPIQWSIASAADYTRDGRPDILWQNTVTGERFLWFMNGTTHMSDVSLGVVPLVWQIVR